MPSRRARPRPRQALHTPHPSRLAVTGASLGLAATANQASTSAAAAGPTQPASALESYVSSSSSSQQPIVSQPSSSTVLLQAQVDQAQVDMLIALLQVQASSSASFLQLSLLSFLSPPPPISRARACADFFSHQSPSLTPLSPPLTRACVFACVCIRRRSVRPVSTLSGASSTSPAAWWRSRRLWSTTGARRRRCSLASRTSSTPWHRASS